MKNLLALDIGKQFWIRPETETGIRGATGFGSIGEIISNLLPNIYTIAGVILFIILIVGGLMFMMGSGQENPEAAKRGKQAITSSLIGFLIIFCSYWIIKIIEIVTGLSIFESNL